MEFGTRWNIDEEMPVVFLLKFTLVPLMPVELHILKTELHRLNLLYENAKISGSRIEATKIQEQINRLHELISGRNQLIKRNLGTN